MTPEDLGPCPAPHHPGFLAESAGASSFQDRRSLNFDSGSKDKESKYKICLVFSKTGAEGNPAVSVKLTLSVCAAAFTPARLTQPRLAVHSSRLPLSHPASEGAGVSNASPLSQ